MELGYNYPSVPNKANRNSYLLDIRNYLISIKNNKKKPIYPNYILNKDNSDNLKRYFRDNSKNYYLDESNNLFIKIK